MHDHKKQLRNSKQVEAIFLVQVMCYLRDLWSTSMMHGRLKFPSHGQLNGFLVLAGNLLKIMP